MSTLTVGRKLTECICRRAVCCRATSSIYDKRKKKKRQAEKMSREGAEGPAPSNHGRSERHYYKVNHPAILGTQVCMDESGVIDMSHHKSGDQPEGQDVRFHSSASWAWWPSIGMDDCSGGGATECIDGATGLVLFFPEDDAGASVPAVNKLDVPFNHKGLATMSRLSTQSLLDLHFDIARLLEGKGLEMPGTTRKLVDGRPRTVLQIRSFKQQVSPKYEAQKHDLLTNHPLLRHWNRRETVCK